jgi:hypothetical protein
MDLSIKNFVKTVCVVTCATARTFINDELRRLANEDLCNYRESIKAGKVPEDATLDERLTESGINWGKGISVSTADLWMRACGCSYRENK